VNATKQHLLIRNIPTDMVRSDIKDSSLHWPIFMMINWLYRNPEQNGIRQTISIDW